jgi:ankyrin repeat protein
LVPVILERFPESVHIASNNGDLPLHAACQGRAPLHLIRLLLTSSPAAVQTPNNDGNLPLHILVKRKPNFPEKMIDLNVLHYLVDQYPEALSIKNHQQICPFDLGTLFLFPGQAPSPYTSYQSDTSFDQEMKGDTSIDVLRTLTPREPEYQQKLDHYNERKISLPFHYALSNLPRHGCQTFHDCQHKHEPHSTQKIIHFLLERDPKSCFHINELGETALHVACRSASCSLETVEFLFTKNPQAVEVTNRDGLYPFLVAAARKNGDNDDDHHLNSLDVIYFLVHRSLFALKNLVPMSSNVRRIPCSQQIQGTTRGNKVSTLCQNDFKELFRKQQEKYDHRFLDLEQQIQELKERQHDQEMSTKSKDCIEFSSCCIIS